MESAVQNAPTSQETSSSTSIKNEIESATTTTTTTETGAQQAESSVASKNSTSRRNNNRGGGKKQQQQNSGSNSNENSSQSSNGRRSNNQQFKGRNGNNNNASKQQQQQQNKSKGVSSNQERSNLIQKIVDYDVGNQKSETTASKTVKLSTGPRKQNLNHLLNFTYESTRDSNENYYEYERLGRQFWSTKLSKNSYFSKEQFLQANCQFVVKSSCDYSIHMCDPDRLVEWDHIEEVHVDTLSTIACPICLYEPTAGKMTKCGHVYCWSCILHYLSLSDKSWRKCPICFESIYKSDLKSVRVIKREREYRVGDEIELTLMFKPRVSKYATVCMPVSALEQFARDERRHGGRLAYEQFADANKYDVRECGAFLKIHAYKPEEIRERILRRERDELQRQFEAEKDQPEVCFVNEALALLEERDSKVREQISRSKSSSSGKKTSLVEQEQEKVKQEEEEECFRARVERPSVRYVDAFEEEVFDANEDNHEDNNENESTLTPPSIEPNTEEKENEEKLVEETNNEQKSSICKSSPNDSANSPLDLAYFYQSSDGQRIFISGFNNRCLLAEYNSLARAPPRVKARIIAADSLFMTEENRRQRFKYLAHLPLHSEFKIVELDLIESSSSSSSSAYLSDKTIALFGDELEERRRVRQRKMAREKRECDRLAAAAAEKEGLASPHYYVPSAMTERSQNNNNNNNASQPKDIGPGGVGTNDYANEFPEASSSPTFSSGASLVSDNSSNLSTTTCSSSSASATSAHSDPALAAQVSFAQMLKHDRSSDVLSRRGPGSNNNSNNKNDNSAWPALEQLTQTSTNMPGVLTLGGWVNMAKQQQQQMNMSGRAKRCQNAPVVSEEIAELGGVSDEHEQERESMPAPSYKQSFFSAIDESLRLIESKKDINDEESAKTATTTINKKKKKTKQLLFSTSLNRGF